MFFRAGHHDEVRKPARAADHGAALRYLPVGEFSAIVMIAPLVVTLLAATILKENVSPLRWIFVAGGFAGTLVIIRPGGAAFTLASLLPLCIVVTNACF